MTFQTNLQNIEELLESIDNLINNQNTIILLQGDLASGKTTLVKKYIEYKGIDSLVTSPTFSIQSIYDNNIYHYDMYNKSLAEFISMGFLEEFEKEGVHFVEWGEEELESILTQYGFRCISVSIQKMQESRIYTIKGEF